MKSVLVIFVISAVAALAHKHRGKYDFEGPNEERLWGFPPPDSQHSSEQFVNSPRIPWDLPKDSYGSPDEDLYQDPSGSSEESDSPRIPWDLPRWSAPVFAGPQNFLGHRGQNRMDWPGSFVPLSQRFAKRSHLDQERMKKIMAELEDVAEKVYETFEILKSAEEENSQEEIENIVSDALEETLNGMNDAKDYSAETGGEKYKECVEDLEDELDRVMEETKEIPMPECSSGDSKEIVDSFEEKVNQFNQTMAEITEINEKINYNIKNCPFRNPRPCHKGLLSLENSARHAIREGHHQIQMMEKAIDMQGVETDQCRDNYLESLIAQENEYNELLEQCSAENSYENEEEYNEILYEEKDYNSENQEDQNNEEKMNENINEAVDDNEEINEEETKEDEEDVNEVVPDNEEMNEEEINEVAMEEHESITNEVENEENNTEEKLEETESTTPSA